LQYSPYILPLLLVAAISIIVDLLIWWRQRSAGSTFLSLLMLAVAAWALAYSLELLVVPLNAKLFWAQVQYLVIPVTPVLWLAFVLQYTGYDQWISRRNLLVLLILPFITTIFAWTNGMHGLIWSSASYAPNAIFPALSLTYGLWFWIHSAYSYLMMFVGTLVILRVLNLSPRMYRGQAFALLMGALAPWLANLLFLTGASPFMNLDLTPFMFTLSGLAVIWGFYRYQLMDIVPVARESVIEVMDDGVIVLNQHGRIVDINPAAEKIVFQPMEEAVGKPITAIIPDWNQMIERTVRARRAYAEIELSNGHYYGLRISRLGGREGEFSGQLIVLRDITENRAQDQEIRRVNRALQVLSTGSHNVASAVAEESLLDDICRLMIEVGGYRLAWVGYLDRDDPKRLHPVAHAGHKDGFLQIANISWAESAQGRGPTAAAIQSGQPAICNNIMGDQEYGPWRQEALRRGYGSSISLPLGNHDEIFGAMNIYAKEFDAFNQEEVRLLMELADTVANGIISLRARSERLQAVEALRDSEMKYRTLFEASNDAILVETEDGMILDCNQSACELFGYSKSELVGLYVRDLVPAEILESLPDITTEVLVSGGMFMETLNKKKTGQVFPARMSTQIASLDGEQVVIVYVRDITAQKRVEEQIRQHAAHSEAMARVSSRLNAQLDLKTVLNAVCEETARTLNLDGASVILYDETTQFISQAAIYGLNPIYAQEYVLENEDIAIWSRDSNGTARVIPDVETMLDHPNARLYRKLNISSQLQVPLSRNGKTIGELNGYTMGEGHSLNENDIVLFESLADLALQSIINARLYEDAQHRLRQVQSLHAIDLEITASMDLFVTLQVLLAHVNSQLGVDSAVVLLFNPELNLLEYAAGSGFRTKSLERILILMNERNAHTAVLERRMMHNPNLLELQGGFEHTLHLPKDEKVSASTVPLIAKGEVKGVLEIFRHGDLTIDPEWQDFLEAFAALAAIAIDNAQLFNDLQNKNVELGLAYNATIEGWSRALDLRDKETEGHTQRVADLTYRLARSMGLRESELVQIHRGALLHDIGKMAIPDRILLKEGNLTPEEWEIMRMHPVYAYELLSPIAYLRPALDIPYCHHERWDGSGYPRGLKGEEIPLAARVFSVVDVWDALLSDRPYRSDWSTTEACHYIRDNAGTHFDPDIVDAFMDFLTVNGLMEECQDLN
jgi:PAS domain S-box-containing protein